MPSRITRLKWPRSLSSHETVLPFLYPRWYSVETVAARSARSAAPNASAGLSAVERDEPGDRQSESELPRFETLGSQPEDTNNRRIPAPVKRFAKVREQRERKRIGLRQKAFYSQDWHTPLALLRKRTPDDGRIHEKQLTHLDMPKGMRGFYPGNLSHFFLDIYLHTGCHVQVARSDALKDDKKTDRFFALEMSGTGQSIKLAQSILDETIQLERDNNSNFREKLGKYSTITTVIHNDSVMPRAVWSVPRVPPVKGITHVHEPKVWSFANFNTYVEELVNSIPSSRIQKEKHADKEPPARSHVNLVTEKLIALYMSDDPKTVLYASMYATAKVMKYLTQHRKIPEVRLLLQRLDSQPKTPYMRLVLASPAVYNVVLDSVSDAMDLHNYNFILRMMTDRNVEPDYATWISLLRLIHKLSPRDAKHVISSMQSRNLLSSPAAKIAAANITAQKDATEWLARGESIFDFIAEYDKSWQSKDWLDTRAGNQILSPLVDAGKLDDAMAVLKMLDSRNRRPNLVTAHILIGAATSFGDLEYAVGAIELIMGGRGAVVPNRDTFDRLARLAWRKRAYNVLRVVWRYACLSGNVSHSFREKMQKSLAEPLPTFEPTSSSVQVGVVEGDASFKPHKVFKAFAARVAVGISSRYALEDSTAVSSADSSSPSSTPSSSPSSSSSSPTTKTPYSTLLQDDLNTYRTFYPSHSLAVSLRTALACDEKWKSKAQGGSERKVNTDVQDLIDNAVSVEVKKMGAFRGVKGGKEDGV